MTPPTPAEIDLRRSRRAQRREAGLVAQYIHELSGRHTGTRREGHPAQPTSEARQPLDLQGG